MYAKHPKLAREFEEKTPKDKKLPMKKAWDFLKESRQTELGEFHPDFPSSYGPVTMLSNQPINNYLNMWQRNPHLFGTKLNEDIAQPYEAFLHEGMKAKPVSEDSLEWDEMGLNSKKESNMNIKPFDLRGKEGNWFSPVSNYYDEYGDSPVSLRDYKFDYGNTRTVGVRMPLTESIGQFRDRGYDDEGPEAFIEGNIPPERLVMMPKTLTHAEGKSWPDGLGRRDN